MVFEDWPAHDLEAVAHCPYCGDTRRNLAYEGVQDWAFGSAPGRWAYWDCENCCALYLAARPTRASIGRAYARYYTHAGGVSSPVAQFKQRLRNELWFQVLGATLTPRLHLPPIFGPGLRVLQRRVAEPFGLRQLVQLPKGLLVDVGCGNGDKLHLAAQLGWRTCGIELDAAAADAARVRGLDVRQGGYDELARLPELADCLICSHVLEHVHEPLALLRLLRAAIRPGGLLLLSTPNARSQVRRAYGRYWRGLEAPRHLAIADATWLRRYLESLGFVCEPVASFDWECAAESERMSRQGDRLTPADLRAAKMRLGQLGTVPMEHRDATQLVCRLPSAA